MFPVLKDLKKESVTWESLFLFDLLVKKRNETDSLLPTSNTLVYAIVKYGWDYLTGVIPGALRRLFFSLQPSHLKWGEQLGSLFSICQ